MKFWLFGLISLLTLNIYASSAIDSELECQSIDTSITILEEYSFQDGYSVLSISNDQFIIQPNKVYFDIKAGQSGIPSLFSFQVNNKIIKLKIPRRDYLELLPNQSNGIILIDGQEQAAICVTTRK